MLLEDSEKQQTITPAALLLKMNPSPTWPACSSAMERPQGTSTGKPPPEWECLLAQTLDHCADACILVGLDRNVLYWNRAAHELYGKSPLQVIGLPCPESILGETELFQEAFQSCLSQGSWQGEFRLMPAGTRVLYIHARWCLLKDSAGQPAGIAAIHSDVTERHLQRDRELRAQRLESIGTMVGGLAHDLNNILHPVSLSLQIIPAESLDAQARQVLETVRLSVDRAGKIIRQVLSFARGIEGEREVFYVEDFLSDIEHFVRVVFPKNIHFECHWPAESRPLRGNPTQLFQAVLNLCINARDAMKDGGRLLITVENLPGSALPPSVSKVLPSLPAKDSEFVRIRIKDTGPGIPESIREKIFERFFTTKPEGSGTGLGLSTTSDILRRHGGCLHLDETSHAGTTFSVFLPVCCESAPAAKSPPATQSSEQKPVPPETPPSASAAPWEAAAQAQHPSAAPHPPQKASPPIKRPDKAVILLVDDEPAVLMVLRIALEKFGYKVIEARSGEEAIEKYRNSSSTIDLVITDVAMPTMNGIELVKAIRAINPSQKFVAATGMPTPAQIEAIRAAGVREVLSKPCGSRVIVETIERILRPA